MSRYTTRTDNSPDVDKVDMGFHHPILEPCKFCDLVYDGVIGFEDFAQFATKWLSEGCSANGGWCNGADFTFDSSVDTFDLAFFADCWLVRDTTPPAPNPPEWEIAPFMATGHAAEMRVGEAVDAWGWDVEYFFDCIHGEGHDSGWIKSRAYIDAGLAKGMEYGYRVKARDELGNETKWSETRFAGTADTTPPTPEPFIQAIVADSSTQITITARTAFDPSGVQYFFDTNTPGAHPSGWIDVPTYTDVNLVPMTRYAYRVKARDLSARLNETAWSGWVYVTTQTPVETIPPTPNPMQFDPNGLPNELDGGGGQWDFYADMTSVTAVDASGGVQYYFEARDYEGLYPPGGWAVGQEPPAGAGFSSGWINAPTWRVRVGRKNLAIEFRVKARDIYGNETGWSPYYPAR